MGRLIDEDALLEDMKTFKDNCESMGVTSNWEHANRIIKEQPTAFDVEAVVKGIVAVHNRTCTEEIDCKGWNCDECFEMRIREIVRGKE